MRQLVACAIAIGVASTAHADGIGIVTVGATDTSRTGVADAMARVLGAGDRRVVVDAVGEARAAVVAGAVPVATLERFRRVREQIDEGWRAFLRVQVDHAASRLGVARTEAEALVVHPGGAVLYADASLRLGAVLAHLGRTADAHAAIALALALDPERPITLAEFSPDIVAVVDAARAQTRPARRLTITSEPPGAVINVDGKDLGRAPLEAELAHGQHVIVARHTRYEPRALAVAVDDASASLRLELAPDASWARLSDGATLGLADAGASSLVESTLRFAELDEIMLVAATDRRGGPALLVQRCAGIPVRCTAVVEIGYADRSGLSAATREAWDATRSADLRYPPSVFTDPRATGAPVEDRCTLCRSPIVWGGVGVAAAIATVVIIAVVSGSRPPPTVAVDPMKF